MNLNIPNRARKAFTLLEVMVAMAILAVVVVAIYSTWTSILKGSKIANDAAAAAQRSRMTTRALHDSLLCAGMFNENAKYYSFIGEEDGSFSTLSFAAKLPKSFPRSGKFGDNAVRRLTFTVEPGPDAENKNQLVLRQNPIFTEADPIEMEHPLVLAKNVEKFLVEYWSAQENDWVTEWTQTNQLPKMARVTIGLGKLNQFANEPQEVMIDTVTLPAQQVRVEWQMPIVARGGSNPNPNPNPNPADPKNPNPKNPNPKGPHKKTY